MTIVGTWKQPEIACSDDLGMHANRAEASDDSADASIEGLLVKAVKNVFLPSDFGTSDGLTLSHGSLRWKSGAVGAIRTAGLSVLQAM